MIVVVGCGKEKREPCDDFERLHGVRAESLYTGGLFRAKAMFASLVAPTSWWILSAKYGLVAPDTLIRPYDTKVTDLDEVSRGALFLHAGLELLSQAWPVGDGDMSAVRLGEVRVELHMGAEYAEPFRDVLRAVGLSPSWPTEGVGIGKQLAWYKEAVSRLERGLPHDL